jgi:hypothetical protein
VCRSFQGKVKIPSKITACALVIACQSASRISISYPIHYAIPSGSRKKKITDTISLVPPDEERLFTFTAVSSSASRTLGCPSPPQFAATARWPHDASHLSAKHCTIAIPIPPNGMAQLAIWQRAKAAGQVSGAQLQTERPALPRYGLRFSSRQKGEWGARRIPVRGPKLPPPPPFQHCHRNGLPRNKFAHVLIRRHSASLFEIPHGIRDADAGYANAAFAQSKTPPDETFRPK